MQNMLLTIVNKQREQNVENKEIEMAIKGLEESLSALTRAETEEVRKYNEKVYRILHH